MLFVKAKVRRGSAKERGEKERGRMFEGDRQGRFAITITKILLSNSSQSHLVNQPLVITSASLLLPPLVSPILVLTGRILLQGEEAEAPSSAPMATPYFPLSFTLVPTDPCISEANKRKRKRKWWDWGKGKRSGEVLGNSHMLSVPS